MGDSRTGAENAQDEPGVLCRARNQVELKKQNQNKNPLLVWKCQRHEAAEGNPSAKARTV